MKLRLRRLFSATSIALAFAVLAASAVPVAASTGPYLVKNINKSGDSFPEQLTAVGDTLLFSADDGVSGRELWKTDGTSAGTERLKDIWPGPEAGWPSSLAGIGSLLYFSADDGVNGRELWVSDGTSAGTRMLEIQPGPSGSDPYAFAEYNGLVYFSATTLATGRELWRTDGTLAGTELVQDLAPGVARSNPENLVAFAGELYFVRYPKGLAHHGVLFKTKGTAAGAKAVRSRKGHTIRGYFTDPGLWVSGDNLLIGRNQEQLWRTRGTRATTEKIAEVGTRRVIDVDGTAFFTWFDGADPYPASGLWITDGSAAGTEALLDEHGQSIPVYGAVNGNYLARLGDKLFFFAENGPYTSDGTPAGTKRIGAVVAVTGPDTVVIDSVAYFNGFLWDEDPYVAYPPTLWRSDGTAEGTYSVGASLATSFSDMLAVSDSVYIVAAAAGKGTELWRYVP
jgi:ELWxxDGT repeat protein